MDFIQQLHNWAKGDITQGRIMAGIGIVLALSAIFIIKSDNSLLKGMLIPVCLLVVMNWGYGGFLLSTRPAYMQSTQVQFAEDAKLTINKELNKATADDKSYSNLKPVWAVLIVVSVMLSFFFTKAYFKGLSLGFTGVFFSVLLVDTFLHDRLRSYLGALQDLLRQASL